jgi:hypothetical protein
VAQDATVNNWVLGAWTVIVVLEKRTVTSAKKKKRKKKKLSTAVVTKTHTPAGRTPMPLRPQFREERRIRMGSVGIPQPPVLEVVLYYLREASRKVVERVLLLYAVVVGRSEERGSLGFRF